MLICIKSCHPVFYADTHPAKHRGRIEKGTKISKYYNEWQYYIIYEDDHPWKLQYSKENFMTLDEWRNSKIDSING